MVKKRSGGNTSAIRTENDAKTESFPCGPILPLGKNSGGKRKKQNENQVSLQRTTLYSGRVWVIENFLSGTECAAWIRHGEQVGFEDVGHPESREVAFRDNGRIEFIDERIAEKIWERLRRFIPSELSDGVGKAVGCHSKIRVYRYVKGQRFGKHIDESDEADDNKETGATVLIYLNGGAHGTDTDGDVLRGGETVFYRDHSGRKVATEFKPMRGALLFHGYVIQYMI